jgi:hypothetical protein
VTVGALASAVFALAAGASSASLSGARAASPPVIDGKLDDVVWAAAPVTSAFTQKLPHEATPPSETTTLRVLYDDDALYIGVDCQQVTAERVAPMARRDSFVESDEVVVSLDTRGEGRSAFEFHVTAAGVLGDGLRSDDDELDAEWDETWDARTSSTPRGWTAEIVLPLRTLRFDAARPPRWGFQVRRLISAKQEVDEWAFVPRASGGEVSRYGSLSVGRVRPRIALEVRPFVVAGVTRQDAGAVGSGGGTTPSFALGVDVKWHVTPRLTLDATVRPDFAQVEADPVVLNLTTYEVGLPEKRPFFLEAKDLFVTPMSVFYTRRVGHPLAIPALPADEDLREAPRASTIEGAMKLTGSLGNQVSVATMSALTGRDSVPVETSAGGAPVRRIVEPLSAYQVLRLRANVSDRLDVGFLGTSLVRAEERDRYPVADAPRDALSARTLCPDGAEVPRGPDARCFHDAHVGSVDARLRSRGGDYVALGQVVASTIQNGPPRAELDGTTIGPGDAGVGGTASLAKVGGEHWLGNLALEGASARLQYNDVGFMPRQAFAHAEAQLEYRELAAGAPLLEWGSWLAASERENLRLLPIERYVEAGASVRTSGFWNVIAFLRYEPAYFDDREVGDGTTLERPQYLAPSALVTTDPRGRLSASVGAQYRVIAAGSLAAFQGSVIYRPTSRVELGVAPQALFSQGEHRYAGELAGSGAAFGRLAAADLSAAVHLSVSFTPRLSLRSYAQVFVAAGHYGDVRAVATPRGPGRTVRLVDIAAAPPGRPRLNPDFEQAALNVNVVLAWEYRAGSSILLAGSRTQSPSVPLADGETGRLRLDTLQRAPATDTVFLKLTYWWG